MIAPNGTPTGVLDLLVMLVTTLAGIVLLGMTSVDGLLIGDLGVFILAVGGTQHRLALAGCTLLSRRVRIETWEPTIRNGSWTDQASFRRILTRSAT